MFVSNLICVLLLFEPAATLPWGGTDFVQYYAANRIAQTGQNPYDRVATEAMQMQLGRGSGVAMFAPPWSLLPSFLLTSLSIEQAVLANVIVNGVLVVLCIVMWCQLLFPGRYQQIPIQLATAVLWFPTLTVLGMGQLSLWPLVGFTGWFWCTQRGWRVAGSIFLVLTVIKPHLGLVLGCFALGYWLKRRDWLSLFTFVLALLAVTVLTLLIRSSIWSDYLNSLRSGASPTDFRTATLECWGRDLGNGFSYVAWCLWLAGMIVAFTLGSRQTVRGAVIACCLAISTVPYAFSFDMVLLLPVVVLAVGMYLERKPYWQLLLLGIAAANVWLIAGKQIPWTETAYWPVPWFVLLITWRFTQGRGIFKGEAD